MKILVAGTVLITVGVFSASYWLDGVYWRSIEDKVKRARERNDYVAELYASIAAEIEKINESTLPELDAALLNTVKRVEIYLDTSHFASVNPEHYARVRGSAWYFEAARLFNTDPAKEEISLDENLKSY